MSAVVLAKTGADADLTCVSMATGTKCLAASAIPRCSGAVLHDSHAEILALRGLNSWLLEEILAVLESPAYQSPFIEVCLAEKLEDNRDGSLPAFRLKEDVSIHFFTTEAPCGDASMEILMKSLPPDAAEPWPVDDTALATLQGRGHFSLLGYVRRKPARADAEASLSKSCTDKLAVKQFSSILSFPTDLFIQETDNAYMQAVVVYSDQYNPAGYQRAFAPTGRLSSLGNAGRFFSISPLPSDSPRFPYERSPTHAATDPIKHKASNISSLWIAGSPSGRPDLVEVLTNGVKQGFKQWDTRPGKASLVSRSRLWQTGLKISALLHSRNQSSHNTSSDQQQPSFDKGWVLDLRRTLSAATYAEAKSTELRKGRRARRKHVTETMGNWNKNGGDDDWGMQ